MRLEGSLDAFSLPDIFALLSMTKKSGGLHLRRGTAHGVVWLSSGALTGGSPAHERQSLLRRVVSVAGVAPEALNSAVRVAREDSVGLVAALVQQGAVDEGRVRDIAAEHIVDTVFSLLRWEDGDFEFVVDEPDRDPVGVERSTEEVVAEARRRLEEWGSLTEQVPAPGTVLRLTSVTHGAVTLEPEQWSMLVLADGRRTVADVVELSGRGEYAAVRSLAGLVAAGVLCEAADGDNVVENRLTVLAGIEGLPAPAAAVTAEPEPEPRPEATAEAEAADAAQATEPGDAAAEVPDADADGPDLVEEMLAEPGATEPAEASGDALDVDEFVAEPERPTEPRPLGSTARDRSRVIPQRPEPFLPGRLPEHPVGATVTSTVGALAAAAEPAPAGHIERDPSVNKSLLLRLIAGVRGL